MSASSAEIPLRQRQLFAGMAGALLSLAVLLVPLPAAVLTHPLGSQAVALARVAVLLLMPGLTLLHWVRPFDRLDDLQRLCLAPLVSLALMPLLLLWVGLAGSRWNAYGVRAFLVACTVRLIISLLRRWSRGRSARSPQRAPARLWLSVGLIATFGAALALRLAMIRAMVYPAWVDSYQHTIITQIILDTGRVPTSYAPFHDLPGFLYHFGFHTWSAFVGWVTGLPAHQAVLWGGQVLNALTVPGLFVLADRLAGDRRAALIAGLIAGLFSRMPAYYVNWGRYPQLAGQVLLPAAVLATAEALSTRRESWRAIPIAALLAGGLLLTHYRIAIFYLAAALVILGATWLRSAQRPVESARPLSWWRALGRLAIIGALATLLTLPWLPDLVAKTLDTAQQVLTASDGTQYDYITLAFVLDYGLRPVLLIALGASVLWALLRARHRPLGLAIVVWLALIVFLANPRVSRLPSGFLTNGTVIMALYLPAALLIGLAASDLYGLVQNKLPGRWRAALSAALVIALLALGGWGGYWLARTGIEPWYQLVTPADLAAMEWVQAHTPVDATFAVGGDFWLEAGVSGHDAGLWLPYIARRQTLVPPVIYVSEGDAGYVTRKAAELASVYDAQSPAALWEALQRVGANWVYRGVRSPQPWQTHLDDAAHFEQLYNAGGVRIYRLLTAAP